MCGKKLNSLEYERDDAFLEFTVGFVQVIDVGRRAFVHRHHYSEVCDDDSIIFSQVAQIPRGGRAGMCLM